MASEFTEFHEQALDEALELIGSEFEFRDDVFTGIINSVELSNDLDEGGLVQSLASVIIIPKSAITGSAPKAGEKVSIDGTAGRIVRVDTDEVAYEMVVSTATK